MTYTLTFHDRDEFLYARLWADRADPLVAVRYMSEIHAKCASLGHKQLLIERDVPGALCLSDHFRVAQDSAAILAGIKTAWVNPYPQLQSDLEFFCMAANNRGSNYSLFSERAEAEKWLGVESLPTKSTVHMPLSLCY